MTGIRGQELLLVEDDENDVELAMRALKGVNLVNRIHVVRDGQEALDYILGMRDGVQEVVPQHPLVILLDLKLPKISGIEVLKRLKSDGDTASIPVVILTSSRESQDLQRCYEMGANSYIVKPYGLEDFTKAVSTAGLYWLVINESSIGD